jgi:hypothetical protein
MVEAMELREHYWAKRTVHAALAMVEMSEWMWAAVHPLEHCWGCMKAKMLDLLRL